MLHRYRFALPLCAGQIVADAGLGDPQGQALVAHTAAALLTAGMAGQADVVLSLAPLRGQEMGGALGSLRRRLAPGGVLVAAVGDGVAAAEAAIAAAFGQVAVFRQRPLNGTLVTCLR